jgi:outer membrane biosynthesis protein TonB
LIVKKLEKSEIYGASGSILFGILLLLLLFLIKLSLSEKSRLPDGDEGLSVDLENSLGGGGYQYIQPVPVSVIETPAPQVTTPAKPAPAVEQPVQNTQELEEAIVLRKAEEQRRREVAEQQRIEAARQAEQRRIQEEQARRRAEIEAKTKGAFANNGNSGGATSGANSGNGGGTNGGTGSGAGEGNAGGAGTGKGTGVSFKVGNRKSSALPKPTDNTVVEGIIVVEITVDEEGNVTEASIGKGTTIADVVPRNAVLAAARKAKFTKGDKVEMGTITYNFVLN